MKNFAAAVFCIFMLSNICLAISLDKLSFMSDFHLGLVSGAGLGLNLGANALYSLGEVKIGAEVEQLMTDVGYSATLNATRFGAVLRMEFLDNWRTNLHAGIFNFMASRDFSFTNMSGASQNIIGAVNYKGNYSAISADYLSWDFIITIKYLLNNINEKGMLSEVDLNIGKEF
ncbi:MAG: hypothetical protein FD145_837 [Candidatus Saganbacteria bacterium]|uniref:Outer membrane protein beta-barrel domain-containing protein n=1 Tax=Candidatus Saganbacteria bacterium TaxID=2575572 RepID=A0A833NX14_UNCSA|nr:MAG: hypothetical protein FD145_837 [Candidatus Saganbacteria bacterium]